jgi:hypothetical protein
MTGTMRAGWTPVSTRIVEEYLDARSIFPPMLVGTGGVTHSEAGPRRLHAKFGEGMLNDACGLGFTGLKASDVLGISHQAASTDTTAAPAAHMSTGLHVLPME